MKEENSVPNIKGRLGLGRLTFSQKTVITGIKLTNLPIENKENRDFTYQEHIRAKNHYGNNQTKREVQYDYTKQRSKSNTSRHEIKTSNIKNIVNAHNKGYNGCIYDIPSNFGNKRPGIDVIKHFNQINKGSKRPLNIDINTLNKKVALNKVTLVNRNKQ